MLKKIFFFFCFCLFLTSSFNLQAAFTDPRLKWKTLKTEHFNIHFYEAEEEIALKLAPIAEQKYQVLTKKLNWKPWGRTEIVVTDQVDKANGLATILPYNYMIFFVAPPDGNSALSYYDNWLEILFTHEFTHILHMDQHGGITNPFHWIFGKLIAPNALSPKWIQEGIAVFEESQGGKGRNHSSYADMILRTDILNNQFLKVDMLSGERIEWPSGTAAYVYGGSFWQYMANTYGEEKITEFINRYGDSMWFFSLNNKARKTYEDKNFFKLWAEWKNFLQTQYQAVAQKVSATGLTTLTPVLHKKNVVKAAILSPDQTKIAYVTTGIDGPPEIRLLDLASSKDELVLRKEDSQQLSFSADGTKLLFSVAKFHKFFYYYNDLFEVDLATQKKTRLTHGKRASDADYSPDGKSIVYVGDLMGSTELFLLDRTSKESRQITHSPAYTQFSNPRFSPDGKQIVVSTWINGMRDLYLYNLEGKALAQLTNNVALENNPAWSKDGKWIYYSSDESGITNIYRIDLENKNSYRAEKLSNVLSGLFQPQLDSKGNIYAQHYFGRGYELIQFTPSLSKIKETQKTKKNKKHKKTKNAQKAPATSTCPEPCVHSPLYSENNLSEKQNVAALEAPPPVDYKIKKYNPFEKLFIPRYLMPGFAFGQGGALFSLGINNTDPLGRHIWSGDITYRTDAQFWGGDFTYTYNRWWTPAYVSFNDLVVNYGNIFGVGENYYEEWRRVSAGILLPMRKHRFNLYYSFLHRDDESGLLGGFEPLLNLGNFSGFGFTYNYRSAERYPASISPEEGMRFRFGLQINDQALGSSPNNETKIVAVDLRKYTELPWADHHVLAFRFMGGVNFGDKLFQGVFRMGSDLGEGILSEDTPFLFPLRGLPEITFSGERALLFSTEYRLPLMLVDRGLGTGPIFLKNFYTVFFSDLGSVFNDAPNWDEFLWGVGLELRGDFTVGYGLPLTARLGYGIIVKGREFLGGLHDPITQASLKYGTLILQVGTSF